MKRFTLERKYKLLPRCDGPFQVLKEINDNAYIIDLPVDYGVSSSFHINDLSQFYDHGPLMFIFQKKFKVRNDCSLS